MKTIFLILAIIAVTISCNKQAELSPNINLSLTTTAPSTVIGNPISKTMDANGGSLNLPSAGATVIVPAGAMAAGAVLTVQATTDLLDNEGQGIQITGDWKKPITLEFYYSPSDIRPENNMIAFQTSSGTWITSRKVKVDNVKKTYSVRLGQTNSFNSKAAKTTANKYTFAAAHEFYLKPEKALLDLGETVNLTAYARAGTVDGAFVKRKDGTYGYYNFSNENLNKLALALEPDLAPNADDDLVPLVSVTKPSTPSADDELEPLPVVIAEAQFTNSKAGFTRSWILMEGPGNLKANASIGAKYTAPKEASAKGQTARVTFFSKNDKTKIDLEASAYIRIKDGLTRYEGTITFSVKNNSSAGRLQACGQKGTLGYELEMNADALLTSFTDEEYAKLGIYGYSSIDGILTTDKKKNNMTTSVTKSTATEIDGFVYSKLVAPCSTTGEKAGDIRLFLDDNKKTFELAGTLSTFNSCEIESYNFCTEVWKKAKADFSKYINNGIKGTYTNIKNIKGSSQNGDILVNYDFKKVE